MMIRIEFISHLREITGTPSVDLDLRPPAAEKDAVPVEGPGHGTADRTAVGADAEGIPVLDLLKALEIRFSKKNLRLLEHNALIKGLLIFKKKPPAGLTRIRDIQECLGIGETLVIGTGMEGG